MDMMLAHISIWRKTSAWLPVVFSLSALAVVVVAIAANGGVPHERDEGAAAHLWQIFMAADALGIVYFLLRWVTSAPRQALAVLGVQVAASFAAIAPVYFLKL